MADAVYKCFLAAVSESVRLLKVGLCLNFCIATWTLPILISCSLTLEVDSMKEPGITAETAIKIRVYTVDYQPDTVTVVRLLSSRWYSTAPV